MEDGAISVNSEEIDLQKFLKTCYELKPKTLFISELKWKYLMRSVIRGKHIMMTGPSGWGKTMTAKAVQSALKRPSFSFNMGAMQDARSSLIGNVFFDKEKGTFFSESSFIKAISTENAVILLDEMTRILPDAGNILMTVLDPIQGYVRLDETVNSSIVNVAKGVTFIATSNIGVEYTFTRTLDRALKERFIIAEMDELTKEQESELIRMIYPRIKKQMADSISTLSANTRNEIRSESPKLSTSISTRMALAMAGLISDGFSYTEASDISVMPFFSVEGGNTSERSYVKKLTQMYIYEEYNDDISEHVDEKVENVIPNGESQAGVVDDLFSDSDIQASNFLKKI